MRRTAILLVFLALAATVPSAQHQLQPIAALRGTPALELTLRKLDNIGTLMMTTAHPDDENNAMLAYYSHGKGFRATLVTATRGEGGQNEIGPELFESLAVLRTEELLAAHKFDGAEQYFTRAVDFGYSFSVEETLEKWGHQEILGDFVRMIRTIRPDIIVGWIFDGDGGGQHHQTSARLSLEAFRAAADPNQFPEQIQEGLRPWQPKKYYYTAGFGPGPGGPGGAAGAGGAGGAGGVGGAGRGGARPAQLTGEGAKTPLMFEGGGYYDPVLGRSCNEISAEARSMHKCQGMSQLLPLSDGETGGVGTSRAYRLRDTVLPDGVDRAEKEPFDGIDTTLNGLAKFVGANPPATLAAALTAIAGSVRTARQELAARGSAAAVPSLVNGMSAVRKLRTDLAAMSIDDTARFEIDFRLKQKEGLFAQALITAADIKLDAVADDGLAVAGQVLRVQMLAAIRGTVPVEVKSRTLNGFSQPFATGGTIPADARLTAAHFKYAKDAARFILDPDVPFGLPFRPTPYTATFVLGIGGVEFPMTIPVQTRSEGNLFSGEKRAEIHVVPAFAVTASPGMVIVPTPSSRDGRPDGPTAARSGRPTTRDIRVTVINHAKGAAKAEAMLELPQGWRAAPATHPVNFSREDEAITVRFAVSVPPAPMLAASIKTMGSRFAVKAVVKDTTRTYAEGYELVEYPHTTRRHVLKAPEVTVNALDVSVKPNLSVGYVMGVGDDVPAALEQLGVKLSFVGADDLAWGDLSRFDVIVTGVRAYERRSDLRAYNQRLLDFARAGGTVIVQYNKFEFNEAQYGPYPGKVGRERVTDENAEPRVLVPGHAVFNSPNTIGRGDWMNWVQERGLYFFDTNGRDPQYTDLVELNEPFPNNQGNKLGALVEARVGQGRWIYVGLGLWRQLPAGTDGAYRLMANLLSLGGR